MEDVFDSLFSKLREEIFKDKIATTLIIGHFVTGNAVSGVFVTVKISLPMSVETDLDAE